MDDKTLSTVIWSWGILLGAIGFLIVFSGGVLGYMFKEHRSYNDSEHQEIKDLLQKVDKDLIILKTQHNEIHCEAKRRK